jgi:dTDP-4-dehydrorhamnose reductase
MRPRVLITGGSGLLALNWALAVRDRCEVVLGLHKRNVSLSGVSVKTIDLDSVESFARVLEEIKPQVVIHTAGLASIEKCESQPELAHHVNVTLTSNVATACTLHEIKLVHISTDHLFSGEEPFATEGQPVAPKNVYGSTKAEAEYRVLEINSKALVIRTNFYGWGTSYRNSFSDAVINAVRAKRELTLFQDIFYTPILAEVTALTVHDLIDLEVSGVFNVVGDERLSKYEFGLKIAAEFGLDPKRIIPGLLYEHPHLVQRPQDMSLSNQRARDLLGRRLGSVQEHIARLHQQEFNGLAQESRIL